MSMKSNGPQQMANPWMNQADVRAHLEAQEAFNRLQQVQAQRVAALGNFAMGGGLGGNSEIITSGAVSAIAHVTPKEETTKPYLNPNLFLLEEQDHD